MIKAAILVAFQIPFTIFYRVLGLSLTETTAFEQFYILDAGFYGASGSTLLGFLYCTVTVAAIWFAVNIVSLVWKYYALKKETKSFNMTE